MSDELKRLSNHHPPVDQYEAGLHISKLERMENFYRAKMPEAPAAQKFLFDGFVKACVYAVVMINKYRKLTKELKQLADEEEPRA